MEMVQVGELVHVSSFVTVLLQYAIPFSFLYPISPSACYASYLLLLLLSSACQWLRVYSTTYEIRAITCLESQMENVHVSIK